MLELTRGKTSEVLIDKKNNFIIKKFVKDGVRKNICKRDSAYLCFFRELQSLKRLQGHENFPKIIRYDKDDLTIVMDYCGEQFPLDGTKRPELVDQVDSIVKKIKESKIKFINQGWKDSGERYDAFPYTNVLLKNGKLKFIDFENSIIEDDKTLEYFDHSFVEKIRKHFNIDIFDNAFRNLILNGNSINKKKYLQQRGKISDMVNQRKFTVKENLWNDYQKTEKNSAAWRIEKLNLRKYASKDKTLLDLGANHGEFCLSLSDDFRHVTAVEPFVEAPEMPLNMTWIKNGFKEFIEDSDQTYDVVFSFAMTIQVRDMQGLEENQIAKGHYKLVSPDGIMIYETQKLEEREINQEHVQRMLASFRSYFGNEIESGEARNSGKRRYYVFKKEA